MARKRMIDPKFWTDDKCIELTSEGKLLFIGMWNFADDSGLLPNKSKQLKAQIFPASSITHEQINELIVKLSDLGLILFGNKGQLIKIKGWKNYQKINRPTPSHYEFEPDDPDDSLNTHEQLTTNIIEYNRIENNGIEKNIKVKDQIDELFEQFYKHYPRKVQKERAYKAFKKLNNTDKELAISTLEDHVKYWSKSERSKEHIPHPASWINSKSWQDELPSDHEIPKKTKFDVSKFKYDTSYNNLIGYCSKCGKSSFYSPYKISSEDSRCCKVEILPERTQELVDKMQPKYKEVLNKVYNNE
tara:strand:+ start:10936 stop:11841 length:906 start_codon:yes stop_codon:yes gene_type:complete